MKNLNFLSITTAVVLLFVSCSSDDDTALQPINEEEVITTMTITLTPNGGGAVVTLQTRDLDGDGPNAPVKTVSGNLATNVTYNGSIELLNETESPAEDITEEVEEESLVHQFFYTANGGLNLTTGYSNFDTDGNPLGTEFTLDAAAVSSGTITFTLRHEPTKPNTGLNDAGGETDITATFSIDIE